MDYYDYDDYYDGGEMLDDILEYNPSTGEWSVVDQMFSARAAHAVSIISTEQVNMYC